MKIETPLKWLTLYISRMAGSASEFVAFHRQEDDSDEQNHCSEVQGDSNVTPVRVLQAGHCQRDKREQYHHRQKQVNFCSELWEYAKSF